MSTASLCHSEDSQKNRRTSQLTEKKGQHENKKEEDYEEEEFTSSLCPSCGRGFDVPLLLPCAHTLCGRCLTEGAGSVRHRGRAGDTSRGLQPICAVLCPRCCHGVELPFCDWSSAIHCLPYDPTVTSRRDFDLATGGKGHSDEGGKSVLVTHVRKDEDITAQKSRPQDPLKSPDGCTDLSEKEMLNSVSGLDFALDPASSAPPLRLSNSALIVTFEDPASSQPVSLHHHGDEAGGRDCCDLKALPQVCGGVAISRGQYYWEVDVCNSALYRIGVVSLDGIHGWWFERRGQACSAIFDGRQEPLPSVPPQLKTVGVFLNVGGFSITFHNPLTHELLAAVPSRLHIPLRPALQLGQGRLKLRPGLPPPNHVFLSRSSAYRRAGSRRWSRDVPFGSVRSVIQKFEELAVSDADSGLMSSYSSSSTLASLPDTNRSPEATHPTGEEQ